MEISIRVTVPKELLNQAQVRDSIAQVMSRKNAQEVKALFHKTVYGWANKPSFRNKMTRRVSSITELIYATGDNYDQYAIVNYGSPPHPIPKTGTTFMRFNWGGYGSYKASSRPRVIQSKRHYKTGGIVTKFKVNHPGFPAREFDDTIAEHYAPEFRRDIEDAVNAVAIRKSPVEQLLKFAGL